MGAPRNDTIGRLAYVEFSVPAIAITYFWMSGQFRDPMLHALLSGLVLPKALAVDALLAAAIVLVFTGNARPWFAQSRYRPYSP